MGKAASARGGDNASLTAGSSDLPAGSKVTPRVTWRPTLIPLLHPDTMAPDGGLRLGKGLSHHGARRRAALPPAAGSGVVSARAISTSQPVSAVVCCPAKCPRTGQSD